MISSDKLGYVQHFNANLLQRLADEHDLLISVTARPGAYVSAARPLLFVEGELGDDLIAELRHRESTMITSPAPQFTETTPFFSDWLVKPGSTLRHTTSCSMTNCDEL